MVKDTSPSSKLLTLSVHLVLFGVLLATIFPVLHVVSMSLSSPHAIVSGLVTFFPRGLQLDGYRAIFATGRVMRAFKNSLLYMGVGTLINLAMTVLMAYPLSKRILPFRSFYSFMVIFTMYFSGGLVPVFILVRQLGLYNTLWALILPGTISAFNMILMRTYFQGLPAELEESAYIDGANDVSILLRIILPLSKASLFTIGLFYAVGHWNAYLAPIIYLKSQQKYPLQVILHEIISANQMAQELSVLGNVAIDAERVESSMGLRGTAMSEMIKYSTLVFSILPMIIIYPFIQQYFVRGVMLGSLKG